MSSASKALELLSLFSADRPEIGLSQLCRIAGRDKATTYRHLQALEAAGFVEQNPATRQYRIGPAVMQLAALREATVPRKAGARAALEALADATGETAHVSVLSGQTLYALDDCESPHHGTRAVIDLNTFPLHATASGLCALAFGPDGLFDLAIRHLEGFTATTATTPEALRIRVETIRARGLSSANQSFEAEIHGIAAPVFDHTGDFAGAVSVAAVASRVTPELERVIRRELQIAARAISHNWGGQVPPRITAAWTADTPPALEPLR